MRSTRWLRSRFQSGTWWQAWVVVVAAAVTAVVAARPAGAIDDDPLEPPPVLGCLTKVKGWMAGVSQVTFGQSTTVSWGVTVPAGCTNVTVRVTGPGLFSEARSGAQAVVPLPAANGYAMYQVQAIRYAQQFPVANWAIKVAPVSWTAYGRTFVQLTDSRQNAAFVEAIATPNTTIWLANHVSLDVSAWDHMQIKPGVQIVGGRSATEPGPLLYTTRQPRFLFIIGDDLEPGDVRIPADNVRISGIRLRGAEQDVVGDYEPSTGIHIVSSLNVEIDNCEISGFTSSAIDVRDVHHRIDQRNGRGAVRIRGNHLHHNQGNQEGYGVEVKEGAYVLVEGNNFGHNRHAMAAGGQAGTGYFFYRNFIWNNGGHHGSYDSQTHQIDMHGTEDDGLGEGYGGVGGEYIDIRYNAITYDLGNAIALRGEPTERMDVAHNAFRHTDMWGGRGGFLDVGAMYEYYEGGIVHWANTFDVSGSRRDAVCDFNGDGVADDFVATGATWWYGAWDQEQLFYLNTSRLQAHELGFGDVNGDGTCDITVLADGRVSRGGRAALDRAARTDLIARDLTTGQVRVSRMDGGVLLSDAYVVLALDRDIVGTGDFDGDGDSDVLVRLRPPEGEGPARQPTQILFLQAGQIAQQASGATSPAGGRLVTIADFDGNGKVDVLWRAYNGGLELDLADGALTPVTWQNREGWVVGPDWDIQAVGDVNGDGYPDLVWRHDTGQVCIWLLVGSIYTGEFCPGGTNPGLTWQIQGIGDFDADGRADLLWRHSTGILAIWFQGSDAGTAYPTWRNAGHPTDLTWQVEGVSDFNADGKSDILWRHTDGLGSIWLMDGGVNIGEPPYHALAPHWDIQGLAPASAAGSTPYSVNAAPRE